MVPKEIGFNKSETASGYGACTAWRFPGSPAMTRDGGIFVITETQFALQSG